MKKRLLNLFLVMLMVVCVLPMAANATSCKHTKNGTTTHVEAKAATCVEPGNIEHWRCDICGKTYTEYSATSNTLQGPKKVSISATGEHNFTDFQSTTKSPTCTQAGEDVYKCESCDATETKEIAATGHHFTVFKDYNSDRAVRPTCETAGKARYGCEDCNAWSLQPVAAHGHKNWPKTKVEPTCTEPGREAGEQCEYCKEFTKGGTVIPATGVHDFSVWKANVTPATCTKREVEQYQCKTCTATENREVGNLLSSNGEHTPGKMVRYITRPTCQATGEAEYECTVCDETVKQVVRKLNCNIVDLAAKAPTCNNTGLTAGKTCTICDDTTKDQNCAYCAGIKVEQEEVDSLGHDQVLNKNHKDYVAATCDEGGVDVWDCTRCGYDGHKVNTKELGHDWDISVLKEATCTIKGMAFYQCKREGCGDWKYVNIDKLGHNKVTVPAVEPTCTATGLTAGEKCDRCNQTFTAQSIVDKLAHAWEDVEAKDPTCEEDGYNAHRACANCDETDGMTVIPAGAAYHNYVNNKCTICEEYDPDHDHEGTGVVTTASTCTTAGVKTFECDTCDYSWTEAVTKAAHVYGTDDRCNACDALNPEHQHTYVQIGSRAPTCTVEGKTTNRCSVCGDQTETLVNAIGHSYANGRCVNCGNPAACEHDNVSSTLTAATCSRAGREVFTCDDCGATVVDRTIAATGKHTYSNNYCTGCGKADPNKITVDKQGVYIVG